MPDRAAHQQLLAAIGAALGQPGPYVEQFAEREPSFCLGSGASPPIASGRELLGGAIEPSTGRVAWIEQRSETPRDGYVPVDIDLRWAADGALLGVEELATYNPYFGCRVEFAAWVAGGFVFAYHEKHRFVLSRLDPGRFAAGEGGQRLVAIEGPAHVHGGVLWFVDSRERLLRGRCLATLDATIPVLIPPADGRPAELFVRDTGELAIGVWDERADVEDLDAWKAENHRARQHALDHAVTLALPPIECPSPALVRACFARAALGLHPESDVELGELEPLAEPWLASDPPVADYRGLRGRSWRTPEDRLTQAARERLAALDHEDDDGRPVAWGWPGLASVADNLDAIASDRLRTGARACRSPSCR